MDTECLIGECAVLSISVFFSYLVYEIYKTNARCLKSLKEAQCLELDNELQKKVENNDGVVKYAVISGNIKALVTPLQSQYIPNFQGVVREKITRECRAMWIPSLKTWYSVHMDPQRTMHHIPFALCGKASETFTKQMSVEVVDPLMGQELKLSTVYDEFISHKDSIEEAVIDFFLGERTLGFQEIERMLCENETITVVGKLVVENSKLKIKPPDADLTYFVTPLNLESLIRKISATTKVSKVISIIMSAISLGLFIYISRHAYSEIKKKIILKREKKQLEEQRKLRRIADKSRKNQTTGIPKCVVCLEYPVEVLILECGHACLCYTCSLQVKTLCPVCRNVIERTLPTFWP